MASHHAPPAKQARTIRRPTEHRAPLVQLELTIRRPVAHLYRRALSAPLVPTTLQTPAHRCQIVFPALLVRAALSLAAHP